ncbi:MAG: rRNA small subunit methyltransferase 1 [Nitrospira sp.]|nr:MAG: rRNA small subunit methyltransferase 1 [Nitrospira sp.]
MAAIEGYPLNFSGQTDDIKLWIISMAREGSQPNDREMRGRTIITRSIGTLYVVSTPIGHPDDITLRALATLRRVTIVASESPRVTQALLAHHKIAATVTSYGPINLHEKIPLLLHRLMQGQDVALVSDNGTPVIYDPGSLLVAAAHQAGIPVKVIPGPSTLTAATAISGFSGDAIIFEGRLPRTVRALTQHLSQLQHERSTLVFYVEPRTLARLLNVLAQVLPARQVTIAIDLTTSKETVLRGVPSALRDQIGLVAKDSAVTVVIEGRRMGSRAHKDTQKDPLRYSSSRRRIRTR